MTISSTDLPRITDALPALQHTRFADWYPHYRLVSPKATFIDLLSVQPDFLDWFTEDGLVLPQDSDDRPVGSTIDRSDSSHNLSDDDEHGEESDEEEIAVARNFSGLNERIRQIIDRYDGAVFPKLDWSAPLDAAWIVPGATLRCTEPSDVYLLIKSSEFVTKDVTQLGELDRMTEDAQQDKQGVQDGALSPFRPHLVLKKFFSMATSHEFRCFVRAGRLVCISQRDVGTFFEHLQDDAVQSSIVQKLSHFFHDILEPEDASSSQIDPAQPAPSSPRRPFPIDDYVWDAYLTRDLDRVFLIDVNPYLERTDALLWEWDEVEDLARQRLSSPSAPPSLRLVTSRAQTTQSFPTYSHNMMPSDIVGLSQGTDIANFARTFNEEVAKAMRPADDKTEEQTRILPGR